MTPSRESGGQRARHASLGTDRASRLFFDDRDYELLRIVDDITQREDIPDHRRLLAPYLHPHGIKEMAAQRPLRIAYAVAHLLGSLEVGKSADRLAALQGLRDEVLYTAQGPLRLNAARVLVEIMKNLIRKRDADIAERLMLARDFRAVTTGRPRIVRAQLARYHLVEMPEEWNQIAFDDHVHDVNTKGRKSATHMVMDAWIKGIRSLTVISYNHAPLAAAEELLEAAAIMEMQVYIGIEFFARFRDSYVKLIWVPRGLSDARGFLDFLSSPPVQRLMDLGREVSQHYEQYVLDVLRFFNEYRVGSINEEFGISLPPLSKEEFLAFVGAGQASVHHLARFVLDKMTPLLRARVAAMRESFAVAAPDEAARMEALVARMNGLDVYGIIEQWFRGRDGENGPATPAEKPELLRLSAPQLLDRLQNLHPKRQVVLNLSDLRVADVLELLYDCRGRITHLEVLNLKNRAFGREYDHERVMELQAAVNTGNVIRLKRLINAIIAEMVCAGTDCDARREKLVEILYDIPAFQKFYADKPLRSSIGTDSTGQSGRVQGMGLVIKETLPPWVQSRFERNCEKCRLPIRVDAFERETRLPRSDASPVMDGLYEIIRRVPLLRVLGFDRKTDWVLRSYAPSEHHGNILALGGMQLDEGLGLSLGEKRSEEKGGRIPIGYMNTKLAIGLKVLCGFIPAFLTFFLTKDWWLLAWFGAVIWFGITGLRNIIQSVLGCGGFHRSSLVRWNSLVSWNRLADSLFFTGFSVPLLDWLVKTMFLDQGFGVTVGSNPLLLYAVMSLVNGLYLSGHNLLRGLPRTAVVGNLFRSLFAIPLAFAFSEAAGELLLLAGVPGVADVLQKWAAIISKLASDCVAAAIEGFADRVVYLRMRLQDYRVKLRQMFDLYARLELLYPLEDVLSLLESGKDFMQTVEFERRDLVHIAIVNALDLQYFWMFQPRARGVLRRILGEMTREERRVFLLSHMVLFREREISQIFLDGLVGRNFARALAFYLDYWEHYLEAVERLADRFPPLQSGHGGTGV